MHNWFVLWVMTGSEQDVRKRAACVPGMETALAPMLALPYRRDGAWEYREQVMIPGYVFLRCRMDSAIYHRVRSIPQVIGWLGGDSLWPTIVPEEEMKPVLAIHQGEDPAGQLMDVEIDKRKRRGRGTLTLYGEKKTIAFDASTNDQKQPENEQVDKRPADDKGDQTPEDSAQA
jgi:transcription antitermination factor NusG